MLQLTISPKAESDLINAHFLPEYRRLQIEHHSVFYKVQASQIIVMRVLHQEMDAPDRLLE